MTIQEYEKQIDEIVNEIKKKRPFDKDILNELKKWFKVAFTYHSNAIEWNTLTMDEVKVFIEDGITIWWKTLTELKETKNYADLVEMMFDFVNKKDFILTEKFILDLHYKLFFDILENNAWKYRKIPVVISWDELSTLPKPSEIWDLMKRIIEYANSNQDNKLKQIAKIHYDFVKIHPFVDGNGRIARLLMNLYLIKNEYLPIVFPVIVRTDYIWSLKSDKKFDDFYKFFLWQMYENMKDYKRFLDKI